MDNALILRDDIQAKLDIVSEPENAAKIVNQAEGLRYAAKKAKAGLDLQNIFAEAKLRAQHKAGELLRDMDISSQSSNQHLVGQPTLPSTLSDMGITKYQSSQWQKIAKVPLALMNEYFLQAKQDGREITTKGVLSLAYAIIEAQGTISEVIYPSQMTLYAGDFVRRWNGEHVYQCVIADPPYNVTNWEWDKQGSRADFLEQVDTWLNVIETSLADEFNLFWFCSPQYIADIEPLLAQIAPIQSRIIWHRRNMAKGAVGKNGFINTWEMIYHVGNRPLNYPDEWNDGRFDVQTFAVPQTNFDDKKLHPTQKPLELLKWLVRYGSYPNDLILDPFAGSGTTGKACQKIGRDCVLFEQSDDYVSVIERRLGIERF